MFILSNERIYDRIKHTIDFYKIPSQVIVVRNAHGFNMSKASNVLKQINSKTGGDLYELIFPKAVTDKRTMLIGIDVCHAGPNSVVGFVATTNKAMS